MRRLIVAASVLLAIAPAAHAGWSPPEQTTGATFRMPKSVAEELHYDTVFLPVTILLDRTGMNPWDTSPGTSSWPISGWPLPVDLPGIDPPEFEMQNLLRRTVDAIQVRFPWPAVGLPPYDGVIALADVSQFMQDESLVIHYRHPEQQGGKWYVPIAFNDGAFSLYSTRQTPEPASALLGLVGLLGLGQLRRRY